MLARRIATVALCALAVLVVAAGSAAAKTWVGLGDSFAAGPLIPNQSLSPLGCLRSDRNFAHQSAASLGYTLTDVSCSGAKTDDMFAPQNTSAGTNAPQLNALTPSTNVVSLQIGGNDIGFTEIIQNCVAVNPFDGCKDEYVVNGVDTISQRIAATAPKVASVIQSIHASAPAARIFVLNYAAILPDTGSLGCWPQVPLAFSDVPYLRAKEKELNAMVAAQATANGATPVDDYTASIGRDACKGSGTRWIEPLVPGNPAAPFHPNLRGMTGISAVLTAKVGS
jgi:GDSL-like lipase/acylhydrolase family protein